MVLETFLVLLIGVGPKLALMPYLQVTAPLDAQTRQRVKWKMLRAAGTTAIVLIVFGELLRALFHFTVASLSIAGGVILLVLAVAMVLSDPDTSHSRIKDKDPIQLAQVPLAVPYLLNPVGIVGLVTISAEAQTLSELAIAVLSLGAVLLFDVIVFTFAPLLGSRLDEGRMLVADKVFGFLIAAIAVQLVLDGLTTSGLQTVASH
jgi:multiple antibiotic resistance protein